MAQALSKLVSSTTTMAPRQAVRQRRLQRLVAKPKAQPAPAAEADADEVELDPEALAEDTTDEVVADDAEVPEESVAVARRAASKKDAGTYLSMYFRDMAQLDVLKPEQEFATAKEIETLELHLWETVFGFAPALAHVVDVVELAHPGIASVKALRKAGVAKLAKAAKKAAIEVRELDNDKLYADAVVAAVDRLARGASQRGAVTSDGKTIPRSRGFSDWTRKVANADREVADARNAFVKANLRLVVSIARRFNHGRMALADLIQEGNLGLMKAVERYDYRRGFRFSTYASWWIRHAISRALADKGREIRLPVHMIDAQHRLAKARRELTSKLGRNPTTEELAEATSMPADKVEKMRSWMLDQSISIDRPVGDEDGRTLGEVLEDPDREEVSPSDDMAFEAMTQEVRQLLGELRPIEADILRRRFGLDNDQELTLKEIGEKYNLSRERIRQLQEQALGKMRRALQRKEMM
ncbi:MAG: sigma-70 family RNA polymerase sigma factor [Deltaproteobacteria bacterium]|nr:sigma-70 family RNA polymerase sigma factor [Deltaproteobacteria bacterium]